MQGVHVPRLVADEPLRYSLPVTHVGWLLHAVLAVAEHAFVLYLPVLQVLQVLQV